MKTGYRIKELRTRRRITLQELANRTGLTKSFLSQLERDLTSPSVNSLEKIARALDTKVALLFEKDEGKELLFVKKGSGRRHIGDGDKVFCETLAAGVLNINMQPQLFTLVAGAELAKELFSTAGENFVMVIKGKIEFLFGEEKITLDEGDSIYYTYTRKLHKAVNIGEKEAKLLLVSLFQYN